MIGQFLDAYMHSVRKIWVPGCHEGSQEMEYDGYRVLCDAINAALSVEKAKWGEGEE